MSQNQANEKVLVLDFGAQYAQLIARRVRDLHVYSEIVPCDISADEIRAMEPSALILSGGPASVYAEDAPSVDPAIFDLGLPILGFCYGHQITAVTLGGEVGHSEIGEYGPATIERDRELERRLTTDVAHELRTPLMAIQSTVEAMVDGVFEADEERLETVNSEVQRLSRLVDAILKLSRLESRSTPMKKEVVNVGELIAGIVATHEAFVADSGLTLKYEMEQGVRVLGDADMIRQATANLISNAVRYTSEGGLVTVRVKRGDIMASISVQDTGIGLTPDEAKMVFSRFWRADAGRTRESGGLGIGLSVVKEIVERHNGWVQVEGRKGEGACFTIHIPLYQGDEQQRGQKSQKSRGKSRKDQK